jgi:hypothetical protein
VQADEMGLSVSQMLLECSKAAEKPFVMSSEPVAVSAWPLDSIKSEAAANNTETVNVRQLPSLSAHQQQEPNDVVVEKEEEVTVNGCSSRSTGRSIPCIAVLFNFPYKPILEQLRASLETTFGQVLSIREDYPTY